MKNFPLHHGRDVGGTLKSESLDPAYNKSNLHTIDSTVCNIREWMIS